MSEHTPGFYLTPEYYERALGALQNQEHFMRTHPGAPTLIGSRVDPITLAHLNYANYNRSLVPEFFVDINTGWHMVEGMTRQAGSLAMCSDVFASPIEYPQVLGKYDLLRAAEKIGNYFRTQCVLADNGQIIAA